MGTPGGIFEGPALSVIAIALAAVAIIVAYIFYRKARHIKQPTWAIRTSNLVREYTKRLPNLDILYDGRSVENLSISKILFWNRGADTIRRSDIAPADPLRIEAVGDVKLVDVKLLQTNNSASQLSATLAADQKSALLDFEFLDRRQGAVFQVVHSGITSKDISTVGTIVGAGPPRQQKIQVFEYLPLPTSREFDERLKPATKRRVMGLIASIPAIMLWAFFFAFLRTAEEFGAKGWALLGMAVFYSLVAGFISYLWGGKVPAGLGTFEEIM